jgi:serine/threonine protein kinase
MINIAEGLEYLHERKPRVIHRDVSPECSPGSEVGLRND